MISYFWPQSWVGISSIKGRYNKDVFFSLERIVFFREPHKILFQNVLKVKANYKKISPVWPKSWVNPFGKSPIY